MAQDPEWIVGLLPVGPHLSMALVYLCEPGYQDETKRAQLGREAKTFMNPEVYELSAPVITSLTERALVVSEVTYIALSPLTSFHQLSNDSF